MAYRLIAGNICLSGERARWAARGEGVSSCHAMVGLPGTKLFEQQWTGLRFDTGSRQWHGARPSVDRAGYKGARLAW